MDIKQGLARRRQGPGKTLRQSNSFYVTPKLRGIEAEQANRSQILKNPMYCAKKKKKKQILSKEQGMIGFPFGQRMTVKLEAGDKQAKHLSRPKRW
jgi:hypothetical protein